MIDMTLTKECFRVIRSRRELMLLPVLGTVSSCLVTILFAVPLALADWLDHEFVVLLTLFGYYYAQQVVVLFASSSLLHMVVETFKGERPTLAQGVQFSMSRLDKILSWACLGGVVGVILHRLDKGKEESRVRRFLRKLVGGAWNLVSFFAFPILILENLGPVDAMRRSLDLIVNTWGARSRAAQGFQAVTFVAFVVGFVGMLSGVALAHYTGAALWLYVTFAVVVPYAILAGFFIASITQVHRVALYLYATDSEVDVPLSSTALEGAFVG
jgi:hypothetical protein